MCQTDTRCHVYIVWSPHSNHENSDLPQLPVVMNSLTYLVKCFSFFSCGFCPNVVLFSSKETAKADRLALRQVSSRERIGTSRAFCKEKGKVFSCVRRLRVGTRRNAIFDVRIDQQLRDDWVADWIFVVLCCIYRIRLCCFPVTRRFPQVEYRKNEDAQRPFRWDTFLFRFRRLVRFQLEQRWSLADTLRFQAVTVLQQDLYTLRVLIATWGDESQWFCVSFPRNRRIYVLPIHTRCKCNT